MLAEALKSNCVLTTLDLWGDEMKQEIIVERFV